jgi:hypothetical protein
MSSAASSAALRIVTMGTGARGRPELITPDPWL